MYSAIDTLWVLIGAVLVFFMQAGFAMVESGFTRRKFSTEIIMKNLLDFSLGAPLFWFIGFSLMFGMTKSGTTLPFIGVPDFFTRGNYDSSYPTLAFLIFQTVFCATSATIVSGAVAERTKFSAYFFISMIISALVYPISGHWIWGGGFLSTAGFHDFAGSTAVHMVGGVAAIIAAKKIGPRLGKYDAEGKARAIPGHSITIGALGVFILWFCWFGFNGCSTLSLTGDDTLKTVSNIFITTNLAACLGALGAMAFTWIKYKKPDATMMCNGALAGLVAITAGCDIVSPVSAAIIGLIAGIVVVVSVEVIDSKVKIDDPCGAFSVHGVCGALGTILTGVFATEGGLLYTGSFDLLFVQTKGVVIVILWVVAAFTPLLLLVDKFVGLRLPADEELGEIELTESELETNYGELVSPKAAQTVEVMEDGTVIPSLDSTKAPLTKVVVVTNPNKFQVLLKALNKIGITGITLTHVSGCGMQKGFNEYYRGVPLEMNLLPKIKVEIVIAKVPLSLAIDTIKRTLHTGKYGDGKIFVYDVKSVVKVRTGEVDYQALQDS